MCIPHARASNIQAMSVGSASVVRVMDRSTLPRTILNFLQRFLQRFLHSFLHRFLHQSPRAQKYNRRKDELRVCQWHPLRASASKLLTRINCGKGFRLFKLRGGEPLFDEHCSNY